MDEGVRTTYTVVDLPFCLKVDLVIQTLQIFFCLYLVFVCMLVFVRFRVTVM